MFSSSGVSKVSEKGRIVNVLGLSVVTTYSTLQLFNSAVVAGKQPQTTPNK